MSLLSKKTGEVLAFANVGLELLERAGDTARAAYGEELAAEMRTVLEAQQRRVRDLADTAKAEKTTLKVRGMMEKYIGDDWDNPIELLEWSGFYLGAAGVHWSLVAGLLKDNGDTGLSGYADEQAARFAAWLQAVYGRINAAR